jgi:predicted dithiol-disulfide oxidoreductase (DUF899 family)
MQQHKIVSEQEWIVARKILLLKEKAFSKERDRLSAERRELPWVKVDKDYVFNGQDGRETLSDLFAGRSQLVILPPVTSRGAPCVRSYPITSTARYRIWSITTYHWW